MEAQRLCPGADCTTGRTASCIAFKAVDRGRVSEDRLCGALMQSLNHDAYDAHLAGLSFTVEAARRGLEVRLGLDAGLGGVSVGCGRLTQALSGKTCGFEDEAAGTRAFSGRRGSYEKVRRLGRDDPIRWPGAGRGSRRGFRCRGRGLCR